MRKESGGGKDKTAGAALVFVLPLLLHRRATSGEAPLAGNGVLMERLVAVLDFVFGCHHRHLSRVFTIDGRTYRVCCDCGAKFKYSLASMCMERRFGTFDAQQVTT